MEAEHNQEEEEDIEWVYSMEGLPPAIPWPLPPEGFNTPTGGDWTYTLNQASETVVHLTVEDRYLVQRNGQAPRHVIDPSALDQMGKQFIAEARKWFAQRVLHAITNLQWPKLESLTIVGLDVHQVPTLYDNVRQHLQPQVVVEYQPGGIFEYDDRGFESYVMDMFHDGSGNRQKKFGLRWV